MLMKLLSLYLCRVQEVCPERYKSNTFYPNQFTLPLYLCRVQEVCPEQYMGNTFYPYQFTAWQTQQCHTDHKAANSLVPKIKFSIYYQFPSPLNFFFLQTGYWWWCRILIRKNLHRLRNPWIRNNSNSSKLAWYDKLCIKVILPNF